VACSCWRRPSRAHSRHTPRPCVHPNNPAPACSCGYAAMTVSTPARARYSQRPMTPLPSRCRLRRVRQDCVAELHRQFRERTVAKEYLCIVDAPAGTQHTHAHTRTLAHAHARTEHTHTRTREHAHTSAGMRAHARTNTFSGARTPHRAHAHVRGSYAGSLPARLPVRRGPAHRRDAPGAGYVATQAGPAARRRANHLGVACAPCE
jgi:hypothetical protein